MAFPPNVSFPSSSTIKPPPVIQQPPSPGGVQLASVVFGTHAPHAEGCAPGTQFGGLWQVTPVAVGSQFQGGLPPPPPLPPPLLPPPVLPPVLVPLLPPVLIPLLLPVLVPLLLPLLLLLSVVPPLLPLPLPPLLVAPLPPPLLPPLPLPLPLPAPLLDDVPPSGLKSMVVPPAPFPFPVPVPVPGGGQFGLKSPPSLQVKLTADCTLSVEHSRRPPKGTGTSAHVQTGPPVELSEQAAATGTPISTINAGILARMGQPSGP